ncbi:MAG: hypothetical protein ACJA2S_002948 [Cyclobacteriaceae bacterium]|jgi:hypothetical protein
MKNFILCALLNLIAVSCALADEPDYPFVVGEELTFKVKFGWFTVGKAQIKITSDTTNKAEPSFHVKVEARTAGILGFFKHTVNQFDAVISQSELKPSIATQNFLDNQKRDIQTNYFDYKKGKVRVERVNYEKDKKYAPEFYGIDSTTYDILSTYLYLRSSYLKSTQPNDSIMVKMFFGNKPYDFGMEYAGVERIKTQLGEIQAHKLYLLFPVSSAFPEPKAVIVWVTMDKNQLPLKIEAQLKFGRVFCDLTSHKNLKEPCMR